MPTLEISLEITLEIVKQSHNYPKSTTIFSINQLYLIRHTLNKTFNSLFSNIMIIVPSLIIKPTYLLQSSF